MVEFDMAEAERAAVAALAAGAPGSLRRTEQLIELVIRAPARARFLAQAKLALDPAAQAEVIVEVVTPALDALDIRPKQVFRARELIADGLRGVVPPPSPQEFLASLGPAERATLREVIDAELARRTGAGEADGNPHDREIVAVYQPASLYQR